MERRNRYIAEKEKEKANAEAKTEQVEESPNVQELFTDISETNIENETTENKPTESAEAFSTITNSSEEIIEIKINNSLNNSSIFSNKTEHKSNAIRSLF